MSEETCPKADCDAPIVDSELDEPPQEPSRDPHTVWVVECEEGHTGVAR